MKNIYLAAPLFCDSEKYFNNIIASIFESNGYKVFLPQRDGYEATKLTELSEKEKIAVIFDKDTNEIKKSDILFIILDGRVPDDGACIELGIAYALGKKCYGLKTDTRSLEKNVDLNPLIAGCLEKIFYNTDDLSNYLHENSLI